MAAVQDKQDPASPGIVKLSGVSFAWPGVRGFSILVDSFELPSGSRTLLLGPSGSGKSTLLSLLCGIATPQAGRVELLGTNLCDLSNAARDRFRAEHIGVIFQMFNLLPYGTAADNVILPLSFAQSRRNRVREAGTEQAEAERLLASLGITEDLLQGPASELSVGQQQRVAAARALIGAPELVIADEPTSALDPAREDRFLELLFAQMDEAGSTLIMVSHDEGLASRFDQVLRLDEIVTQGDGK